MKESDTANLHCIFIASKYSSRQCLPSEGKIIFIKDQKTLQWSLQIFNFKCIGLNKRPLFSGLDVGLTSVLCCLKIFLDGFIKQVILMLPESRLGYFWKIITIAITRDIIYRNPLLFIKRASAGLQEQCGALKVCIWMGIKGEVESHWRLRLMFKNSW